MILRPLGGIGRRGGLKIRFLVSAGSSPAGGTNASVAQWIRASRFERDGRGFESLRVLQLCEKGFVVANGKPGTLRHGKVRTPSSHTGNGKVAQAKRCRTWDPAAMPIPIKIDSSPFINL